MTPNKGVTTSTKGGFFLVVFELSGGNISNEILKAKIEGNLEEEEKVLYSAHHLLMPQNHRINVSTSVRPGRWDYSFVSASIKQEGNNAAPRLFFGGSVVNFLAL